MSKIKAITITNFKRISTLDITDADRAIVVLGGRNGQGKSSAMDAIATALGGGKLIPAEPIRKGSDKGEVSVTTDDEITIKRTFAKREDGTVSSSLTIRTADGMSPRGAQGWLDARLGNLAVDPVAFMGLPADKQAERLREIAGIDTRPLDAKRRAIYDERRDIGRDGTTEKGRLDAMPHYPDSQTEPVRPSLDKPAIVNAADILDELARATETERAAERAATAQQQAEDAATRKQDEAESKRRDVADLERRLEIARQALMMADEHAEAAGKIANDKRAESVKAAAAIIDPAPIRARLADVERINSEARAKAEAQNVAARAAADEANRKREANLRRAEQDKRVQALRDDYAAKTAAIEAIDSEKAATLRAARFPVDGLGFSETGAVTYQSVPLEQASGAEKLRVSMALALAGDPEIRVVLIRDASLLDDDSMALVASMAEERGAQVWLERVGDRDPGAIVIEDGGVR